LIEKTGLFDEAFIPLEKLQEPWPIAIALPALAMFQIALFDVLTALGTKPDIVLGHSAGETAVLYASGASSKAAAVELAIARGRAMSVIEHENGSMAALSCSPEMAQGFIDESGVDLDIACYNTPNAITLSGLSSSLDKVVEKAEAVGIFGRRLRTRVPVHSSMMEACQSEYRKFVEAVFERHSIATSSITMYSTGSGKLMKSFTPDYFWDSARGPVLFSDAIQSLLQDCGTASYVEISPHPVLTSYLDVLNSGSALIVCPMRRPKPGQEETEVHHLLDTLGKLVVAGHNCVDFNVLNGTHGEEVGHLLPRYPFVPRKVVLSVQPPATAKVRQSRNGPLNPHLQINAISHPQLAQHVIKAQPIMPATGFLEMVRVQG
jgi:acyl transferase domain-containing protein